MTLYLLDTNTVSYIIRDNPPSVRRHLVVKAVGNDIAISVVTLAELLYGVAKRGHPRALTQLLNAFLAGVTILPWTEDTARHYARLRADCEARGINLADLDMMIAAQAGYPDAVLVTRDKAFGHLTGDLTTEDWTV